jgi:hypothetical protein
MHGPLARKFQQAPRHGQLRFQWIVIRKTFRAHNDDAGAFLDFQAPHSAVRLCVERIGEAQDCGQ